MAKRGGDDNLVLYVTSEVSGAVSGFKQIQAEMRQTARAAKQTGDAFRSAFTADNAFRGFKASLNATWSTLKTFAGWIGGAFSWAWGKLKLAVLGVGGVLAGSLYAWNKEASAQAKLNSLLKANIRDYQTAGRLIDATIRRTQRRTNFGDDDVRNIFGSFLQINGSRGVQLGQRFTAPILDLAAARGYDPEGLAETIARAIATRQSSMLRRQGIVLDEKAFKRDPSGTIYSAISSMAGGAATADRRANPLPAFKNSLGELLEGVGSVVATVANPAIEALAQKSLALAESLGELSPAELWRKMAEYGAGAWKFITEAGVNMFAFLKSFVAELFKQPIATFREVRAQTAQANAAKPGMTAKAGGWLNEKLTSANARVSGWRGNVIDTEFEKLSFWDQARIGLGQGTEAEQAVFESYASKEAPLAGWINKMFRGRDPKADAAFSKRMKEKYGVGVTGTQEAGFGGGLVKGLMKLIFKTGGIAATGAIGAAGGAALQAGAVGGGVVAANKALDAYGPAVGAFSSSLFSGQNVMTAFRAASETELPYPDLGQRIADFFKPEPDKEKAESIDTKTLRAFSRRGAGKAFLTQKIAIEHATQAAAARTFLLNMSGGGGAVGADALGIIRQMYGDQVADAVGAGFRKTPAQAGTRGLLSPYLALGGNEAIQAALKDRQMEQTLVKRATDSTAADRRRGALMPAF